MGFGNSHNFWQQCGSNGSQNRDVLRVKCERWPSIGECKEQEWAAGDHARRVPRPRDWGVSVRPDPVRPSDASLTERSDKSRANVQVSSLTPRNCVTVVEQKVADTPHPNTSTFWLRQKPLLNSILMCQIFLDNLTWSHAKTEKFQFLPAYCFWYICWQQLVDGTLQSKNCAYVCSLQRNGNL